MTTLNKELLLEEIDKAILLVIDKENTTIYKYMYKTCKNFLTDIRNIVVSDETPNVEFLKKQALRLGMYSIKEVAPEDREYSKILNKVTCCFEDYYKIGE